MTHEDGVPAIELPGQDALLSFLRARGAATMPHPGGTLLAHLRRTTRVLASWGASNDLLLASLAHAVYGTDGFAPSLADLAERPLVRELVGDTAEAIVYRYAAADRSVVWAPEAAQSCAYRDRFTGEVGRLEGTEALEFWDLSAANELDLVDRVPDGVGVLRTILAAASALSPVARDVLSSAIAERASSARSPV